MKETIEDLAIDNKLGNLIEDFGFSRYWLWWILKLCLFLLPFSLIMMVLLIGVPCSLFILYCIYWSIRGLRAGKILLLYEHGLIDKRRSKPQIIRYEEITAFWKSVTRFYKYGSYRYTQAIYTVQTKDGQKRKYVYMENPDELGNLLSERLLFHQLPGAIASYYEGHSIDFDKVSLHQGGISLKRKTLYWSELETVKVNQGIICIRKKGKRTRWAAIKVAEFPNVDLFLAMVHQIHSESREKSMYEF